jgi:hypothetical protein
MRGSILTTIGVLALALALVHGQETAPDLQTAGEQAYLFAYPLVLVEATRRATPGPSNQFTHLAQFPDDKFRLVVLPNTDTLYSSAPLDLSKEPVLLHVPDTHGRYYVMQVMDGWTETVSAPGKRTTGTGEGWFAIVGPGWNGKLPDRAKRIDCPTNMAWLLGRTQTDTAADYSSVHALQQQYLLMPLGLYPAGPKTAPATSAPPAPSRPPVPPPRAVAAMTTAEFFTLFAQLLAANPPHAADAPMVKQLAALGVEAGKPFSADRLGPAFEQGVTRAKEMLESLVQRRGTPGAVGKTGWSALRTTSRYGTNYAARAAMARIALGINPPEDAVYLACARDATGAPLEGARQYVMHFAKGQFPPVQAFWSVTMYDEAGYFTANPLNRYALGDRDRLKYNADGSLDLYVQHESPGPEQEGNWVPAPAERFNLALRLYWPKESVLKGAWVPPAVRTAPGVR